ncbi:MAG: epoxyqueuosine reductase QueH [Coriobacteriaceae bacterium]|nr:epoxyqueuosine reductase QueH [Coriobacteriaceae bacterium]
MKTLLHACCGPCSLEPVRLLKEQGHELTIGYMNSNIHPQAEYTHRLETLLAWARDEDIPVVEGEYDPSLWAKAVGTPDTWGEGHIERCRRCYRMRLEAAADYAVAHRFEALSTTLAVSPYQFTEVIHEELEAVAATRGLAVIFEDFRPYYPEATRRSRALGMYRQNFCGCGPSNAEAAAERKEFKRRRAEERARREAELAPQRAAEAAERERKKAERAAYEAKQHAKKLAREAARRARKEAEAAEAAAAASRHVG